MEQGKALRVKDNLRTTLHKTNESLVVKLVRGRSGRTPFVKRSLPVRQCKRPPIELALRLESFGSKRNPSTRSAPITNLLFVFRERQKATQRTPSVRTSDVRNAVVVPTAIEYQQIAVARFVSLFVA